MKRRMKTMNECIIKPKEFSEYGDQRNDYANGDRAR